MTPKLEQFSFQDQKVLMRVDFNVPLNDQFEITDDSRIRAALPSIHHILNTGGSVIIMSHLGRPKNGPEEAFSLKHIVSRLSELTQKEVHFANDCLGQEAIEKSQSLASGEILVLENLRFYKEETKGDSDFARKLASLGDFYVNDAFGTAHRAHASTAIIAEHFEGKKSFGFLMAKEIDNAEKVMQSPKRPFTAIVGGAKVSDKILIVENLLNIADHILIGGGMAYTFFKAQGGNIGNSLCEDDRLDTCRAILKKAEEKGVKIHLPADSIIADKFDAHANTQHAPSNEIADEWMGLDIGNSATEQFGRVLLDSHTILWNGPMGVFEMEAFENGTKGVAEAVAKATENGAFSLIGGGDSAAAVYRFGFEDQVSYVSTGGGALLEYFEGKQLPGIAAING
jgi:phosphoglycerate kinase